MHAINEADFFLGESQLLLSINVAFLIAVVILVAMVIRLR